MASIVSTTTGIFQDEKVVAYFETLQQHFNQLLQTLSEKNVYGKGLQTMRKWSASTVQQEWQKLKEVDEDVPTLHQVTMCHYLKDRFKPSGMKIRVRPPKPEIFLRTFAQQVAQQSEIASNKYLTLSVADKDIIMKRLFRHTLRKVCGKSCVVDTLPSQFSLKSKNASLAAGSSSQVSSRATSVRSRISTNVPPSNVPSSISETSEQSSRRPPNRNVSNVPSSQRIVSTPSIVPDDSVSQFDASHVSSRANTVHDKLTESMLALHRKKVEGPDKVVSLKAGSTKSNNGFFQLGEDCNVPSEVMESRVPSHLPSQQRSRFSRRRRG